MVADLMSLKQQGGETIANFMERFLKLRSRCNVKLPKVDYAIIVTGSMHPQLSKRLIALEYANLNQLITKAFRIE